MHRDPGPLHHQERKRRAERRHRRRAGPCAGWAGQPDRPLARRSAHERGPRGASPPVLARRVHRRDQAVGIAGGAGQGMRVHGVGRGSAARGGCGSRPAALRGRQPAAERVQVHPSAQRSDAQRVCAGGPHPDRRAGPLRRAAAGLRRADVQALHPGAEDRSGLGLGLSIARRSVEANNGVLRARDLPGIGCVFTIDLPRHYLLEGIHVAGHA